MLTIGFYYVLAAAVINVIVFFYEFFAFISNIVDNKPHGNSAVLLLLKIPISIVYFLAVINCDQSAGRSEYTVGTIFAASYI